MRRVSIIAALAVIASLVLLWRETRTPVNIDDTPAGARVHPAHDGLPSLVTVETRDGLSVPTATGPISADPIGGVRAWSPAAAPKDGPDPFAPVPEVRTADDTRAGLAD